MRFNTEDAPKGQGGGRNLPPEGDAVVECVDAEEKRSQKNGDPYMSLKLKMDDYNWHVYDVVMFAGKGAGIGKKKAEAFGVDVEGEVGPDDFIGRRVLAHLVYESYEGKRKLAVDISQGEYCGFDMIDGGGW